MVVLKPLEHDYLSVSQHIAVLPTSVLDLLLRRETLCHRAVDSLPLMPEGVTVNQPAQKVSNGPWRLQLRLLSHEKCSSLVTTKRAARAKRNL